MKPERRQLRLMGHDDTSERAPAWAIRFVQAGAALVLVVLFVSAVFDPTIRVLHALQAVIYIPVIIRARKDDAWALGAGCIIALFWNYVNLSATTFIASGLRELGLLVTTGQLARPDQLIAVIAAAGHVLLIVGALALFLRLPPGLRLWGRFLGGGVLAIGYFALIIITTGPRYIGVLRRAFGL